MDVVVLFDVDLTMIRTNGAGGAAMTTTMRELTTIDDAFAGVSFAGRTDRALLREALDSAGHVCDDFDLFCRSFEERYLLHLDRELRKRGGELLPGVTQAVTTLARRTDVRLGLATGNFRRAAE